MSLSRMTVMSVGVKSLRARLKGDVGAVSQAQMEASEYDDFPEMEGDASGHEAAIRREGRGLDGSGNSRKDARS